MIRDESDFFRFKKLTLKNREAAFRINTDGVLLAAWTRYNNARYILDIGTGTGVIALIAAAETGSENITGIDIDERSVEEARFNASLNKLQVDFNHCDLSALNTFKPFDLIISNPPFFTNDDVLSRTRLSAAKHTFTLDTPKLWSEIPRLSHSRTQVALIFPFSEYAVMNAYASEAGFSPYRICYVRGKEDGPILRAMVQWIKGIHTPDISEQDIHIRNKDGNSFGEDYRNICSHLYLKF